MRVFEKDGQRQTTGSPAAAVNLLATGWVEVTGDDTEIPRGVVTRRPQPDGEASATSTPRTRTKGDSTDLSQPQGGTPAPDVPASGQTD